MFDVFALLVCYHVKTVNHMAVCLLPCRVVRFTGFIYQQLSDAMILLLLNRRGFSELS